MAKDDWTLKKEERLAAVNISASGVQGFNLPKLTEQRFGGARGLRLAYDGDVNAKLKIDINDQTFILPEGVSGVTLFPDEDIQTEFLSVVVTNQGSATANNVQPSLQIYERK